MTDQPQINPSAREWLIVEEWAEKRLADYRKTLEKYVDEAATNRLRARINELLTLLALGNPTPEPTADARALPETEVQRDY